jgi:hypothetical protein
MIHHTQGAKAEYIIAQYMDDVFRREVRNVGVLVQKGGEYAAKFFGEAEPGTIDGRKIRGFAAPDVYKQWIQYWRRLLTTDPRPFETLRAAPQGNYLVSDGGEVLDSGQDTADDVASFLYSALVAEGGLAEAYANIGEADVESSVPRLNREVEAAFRTLNILADTGTELPLVHHPVIPRPEVRGTTSEPHRPMFMQQNAKLYVMETVDFTERAKERARDHAGFASFMFDDIRKASRGEVIPIAIVRLGDDADRDSLVRYGLSMLNKTAAQLVNWQDSDVRTRFIEDRRRIALATT